MITKEDLTRELNRLDSIIRCDTNPVLVQSAKSKKGWVLEFMRSEFKRTTGPKRSKLPTLAEQEAL